MAICHLILGMGLINKKLMHTMVTRIFAVNFHSWAISISVALSQSEKILRLGIFFWISLKPRAQRTALWTCLMVRTTIAESNSEVKCVWEFFWFAYYGLISEEDHPHPRKIPDISKRLNHWASVFEAPESGGANGIAKWEKRTLAAFTQGLWG